jgi:hypothetical protein
MRRQLRMNRPRRCTAILLVALALMGACSSSDDGSAADTGGGPVSTTAPAAVDAVLLPAEGPLQAGTYAVPGFVPLLTMDLGEGWTVIGRSDGAVTLAYEFDPEGRELARLNIGEVTGTFDAPFVGPEIMQVPGLQQARVRPLPAGGLEAVLGKLPGVTVSDRADVEVAGVKGARFTTTVGELPAEAKEKCPQIPAGCVAAYDLPGPLAAIFPGGTTHEVTTFRAGAVTYVAAVAAPSAGPPAGFTAAAAAVIASLALDRPVKIAEAASLGLFADAIADVSLRPLARSITAPGSPAATFMAALDDDWTAQLLAGNTIPKRDVVIEDGTFTISGGPGTEVYESFTYEDGRVAAFNVQGKPIDDFVTPIEDAQPVRVGPLEVTPLEVYKSFASGRLWVPISVVNGAQAVALAGLTVTHVATDGTSRPTSQPVGDLEVAPHWNAPFTLTFDDAPLGGTLVFGGTIGGQAIDASIELPDPSD